MFEYGQMEAYQLRDLVVELKKENAELKQQLKRLNSRILNEGKSKNPRLAAWEPPIHYGNITGSRTEIWLGQ